MTHPGDAHRNIRADDVEDDEEIGQKHHNRNAENPRSANLVAEDFGEHKVKIDGEHDEEKDPTECSLEDADGKLAHDLTGGGKVEHGEEREGELDGLEDVDPLVDDILDALTRLGDDGNTESGNERHEASEDDTLPTRQADLQEALHDILASKGAGHGSGLACSEEADGPHSAGGALERVVENIAGVEETNLTADTFGVLRINNPGEAVDSALFLEEALGEDGDDGKVHNKGDEERDTGVDGEVLDRLADVRGPAAVKLARGNRGRVQVQVVGHDDRAEEADELERCVARGAGHEDTLGDLGRVWTHHTKVNEEANGHGADQGCEEGLKLANAKVLEAEEGEGVDAGDESTGPERKVKENLEGDSGADDLLNIVTNNDDFRKSPQGVGKRTRVFFAADLGEVLARDSTDSEREDLAEPTGSNSPEKHPEELIAGVSTRLKVSHQIARV